MAPLARFDQNSCSPHSDWRGVSSAVVAVSVYVHDTVDADRAPLVLYTKNTNRQVVCTGSKGMVIIRDVDIIHRGQINNSPHLKAVPCIRFFLPNALRQDYNPVRFLTYDQALAIATTNPWAPSVDRMMHKLLLVIQSDHTAMPVDLSPASRLPLPASMGDGYFIGPIAGTDTPWDPADGDESPGHASPDY